MSSASPLLAVDSIIDDLPSQEQLSLPSQLQLQQEQEQISFVDPTLDSRKRALAEARQRRKDRERERERDRQRQPGDTFSTPTASTAPQTKLQSRSQQPGEVIDLTSSPESATASTSAINGRRNAPATVELVDDDDVIFVSSTAPLPLPRQTPAIEPRHGIDSYFGGSDSGPSTPIGSHAHSPLQQQQHVYPMLRNDLSVVQQILNGSLMIGHRFMPYISVNSPSAHTPQQQALRPASRMLAQPVIEPDPEPSDPARLKCALCQSVPDAKTALSSTICGHIFCEECLKTSLKSYGKKCPNCRKSLAGKNAVHRLYF
ncbi:hypothetical protein HDU82_008881 [Entophlyctis luteolus]|nr:hypothetical protein HDU82_008881 [Entophlyctis luteolus]